MRQSILRQAIAEDPRKAQPAAKVVLCVMCTSQQKHEFECGQCDRVKARERFSATQVRNLHEWVVRGGRVC